MYVVGGKDGFYQVESASGATGYVRMDALSYTYIY